MKILVTGAAGFIGAALVKNLLADSDAEVTGLDNLNSYYAPKLKADRLADIGDHRRWRFVKGDICDRELLMSLFEETRFDVVVNLAAQAGVRYSIENPEAYIQSNVVGFLNILECMRRYPSARLVYASSSSVYGDGNAVPYREDDMTDTPVSLYAATKKSDELMAHAYSHLYHFAATGLRFFTVYGPWGRPDMAPFLFLDAVMNDRPIRVFNHGEMKRDFTYIDDVVRGIRAVIDAPASGHKVYNIGRSEPVNLMDFIRTIECVSGRKCRTIMEDMQPGDVTVTYADTTKMQRDFGFVPRVDIADGITAFYRWYCDYAQRLTSSE